MEQLQVSVEPEGEDVARIVDAERCKDDRMGGLRM